MKGSTINRKSSENKLILKDVNFLEIQKEEGKKLVRIDDFVNKNLLEIIKIDSEFLKDHNILDYSLLLTIENLSESET